MSDPSAGAAQSRTGRRDRSQSTAAPAFDPTRQAFRALQLGFVAAPVLAGLDKFFHLLTDWTQYLWSGVPELTGLAPQTFLAGVGVVEIAAGLVVAVRPRLGGYLVAAWLVGIIANLLLTGGYLDIALRDLGLAIGAFALARLAEQHGR